MPPKQVMRHPCGCEDEVWGWMQGPMRGQTVLTNMCYQHVAIANAGGGQPQGGTRPPPGQIPTTTGGIPLHPFQQFQMGGFGHPFQMPHPGAHRGMQPPGAGTR